MNITENLQKLFSEKMMRDISKNLEVIKSHIATQKDTVVITTNNLSIEDITKKVVDPHYLQHDSFRLLKNGIQLLVSDPRVYQVLKDSISKDVKNLAMPLSMLPNLEELSKYPNLKELNVTEFWTFNKEELDSIKENTALTKLTTQPDEPLELKEKGEPGFVMLDYPIKVLKYKDIILTNEKTLPQEAREFNIIINNIEEITQITDFLKVAGVSSDRIEKLNIYTKEEIDAKTNKPLFTVVSTQNSDVSITVNNDNIQTINTILDKYTKQYQVKEINLNLKNKTYTDIETLAPYSTYAKIMIDYGEVLKTDYESFMSMRATMDWYKDIITASSLSPTEKTMYAYDIIKSFQYKENEKDKSASRYIPNIIESGNIVCVGYASFLAQLLTELEVPTIPVSVTCKDDNNKDAGHKRNLVRIEDNKYNIHGIFSLDATWDSKRKELSQVIDKEGKTQVRYQRQAEDAIVQSYDGLTLYQHFLVPYQDYRSVYNTDSLPQLYKAAETGEITLTETISEFTGLREITRTLNNLAEEQIDSLFEQPETPTYINNSILLATKPSITTFERIISTVRQEEGYTKNYLKESVTSTIELNQMLTELYQPAKKTIFANNTQEEKSKQV